MKRTDFIKIIKLRSFWKIDKRKGNYKLPSGERLSDYVRGLVESQMKLDRLGIRSDGNLCACSGSHWNPEANDFDDYVLMPDFGENEYCAFSTMEIRVKNLVFEIIG